MRRTAPGRDGMTPGVENHAADPRDDGGDAVQHTALDQRFEGRSQYVEEIVEIETGEVVAGDKQNPSDHARRKHPHRALEEADNRNQQKKDEQAEGSSIALERIGLESRKAIGRDERGDHDDVQEGAEIDACPERRAGGLGLCENVADDWVAGSGGSIRFGG